MKIAIPRLYLGSMTFAWGSQTSSVVDEAVALEMARRFLRTNEELGVATHRIDTARVYAGGDTEPMVGHVLQALVSQDGVGKDTLLVGTKAHPSVKPGGLSKDGVVDQFRASTKAMNVEAVEEYYLHQPDTEHSLLESLRSAHELVQDGKVRAVGMSNYHASEMKRAFLLCKEHDLTPPTVYQGLYNPLNRLVEDELMPVLRANGCSFIAYNPLAAGFLTGKHKKSSDIAKGRFKDNPNYFPRFYTDANFEAIELIQKACDEHAVSMVEATYRWLLRHSQLKEADGVLLGASSLEQLDQNLDACRTAAFKDDLPESINAAFDAAWKLTRSTSFPYWRSYSSDMPNRESLDQGASYNAAKTK